MVQMMDLIYLELDTLYGVCPHASHFWTEQSYAFVHQQWMHVPVWIQMPKLPNLYSELWKSQAHVSIHAESFFFLNYGIEKMQIPYHKCIVGDHMLFYLGTQKMQKSCHGYIVGKHFCNLGTQKGADSSNKSTTSHHFFFI